MRNTKLQETDTGPGATMPDRLSDRSLMPKPYLPPPYIDAALQADLRAGFPSIFAADNLVVGERTSVVYEQKNWQLTAVVTLRWQLAGEEASQQMVDYRYQAAASAPGGFTWVCESA